MSKSKSKVSTASVEASNKKLAIEALDRKKKAGSVKKSETVLSIADHGDYIMVYTGDSSFGVRKNVPTRKAR